MARKTLLTESELRRFMKLAQLNPVGDDRLQEMGAYPGARDEDDPEALEDYAAGDLERGHPDEAMADEEEAADELDDLGDEMGGGADEEALLARVVQAVADELDVEVSVEGGGEEEVEDVEMDLEEPGLEGGEEEVEMDVEEEVPMMEGGARVSDQSATRVDYPDEKTPKDKRKRGHGESGGDQSKTKSDYEKLKEDSGEDETWHQWKNEHADDDHIKEIEHHLRALKDDRDYERHEAEYDHDKYEDKGYNESKKRQDAIVSEVAKRVAARLAKENKQEEVVDQLAERIMARLTK